MIKKVIIILIFISSFFLEGAYTQNFSNPSLELWGLSDTCYVNIAPNDWFDYTITGLGMDKIDFLLCPTTRPSSTTDGNNCGRMDTGEGMYQEISGFTSDTTYNISFDYVGSDYLNDFPGQNQIHLFIDDIDVGQTPIFNSTDSIWNNYNFNFTATQLIHKIGVRLYKISGFTANAAVDNFKLLIQNPNEIKELITNNRRIKIFPNPSVGLFTIQLNNQHLNPATVQVTINDITGKWVNNMVLECNNNKIVYDKNLGNGVYFVTIKIPETDEYFTQKLTIIK